MKKQPMKQSDSHPGGDLINSSIEPRASLSALFPYAAAGMSVSFPDGALLQVNPAYCEFLGYSQDELLRLTIMDVTHPEDRRITGHYFALAIEGKTDAFTYEKRFVRKDGAFVWGLVTVAWVRDGSGEPLYCVALIQDINPLKTSLKALQEREELYRTLVENVDLGITLIDAEHRVLMVNKAFSRRFEKSAESFNGKHCFSAFRKKAEACADCPGARALESGKSETVVTEGVSEDGRRSTVRVRAFPVFNSEGKADRFIEIVEDISERVQDKERLDHLAYYDQLTNLPNRTLLMDRLNHALARARRFKYKVAVMFLDLDRFKIVNDSYGHHIGDKVLEEISAKLSAMIREADTLARFGGDEFILLIEQFDDLPGIEIVAKKILAILKEPVLIGSRKFHLSASIGISIFPEDGRNSDKLLRRADAAMYRAKEGGRNAYYFFKAKTELRAQKLLKLENEMRSAIDDNHFILHYQPQVNLKTREIIGFEALIRWQHPINGMISPGDFIPLAEETGMIISVGRWALETACLQARRWQSQGKPTKVAVNISALQFRAGNFPGLIEKILLQSGLSPEFLELELTESIVMGDVGKVIDTMHELSDLGVSIAIDDFGTGYSSLNYLKRFPMKRLKIDQSFISDVEKDPNSAAIADAVISLGQSLGLEVLAEGVETEGQMHFLLERGCTQAQGFLFGRPVPAEELGDYP